MHPWSVIVAVPARNEQRLLGRCLAAVSLAATRVAACAHVHVVVAADSCTDGTEQVAIGALSDQHASIVRLAAHNVGVARAAAVASASMIIAPAVRERVWIAMTDADSRVPPDWLEAHLRAANAGYHAVVGGITVHDWAGRNRGLDAELQRHRLTQRRDGRKPVHGANLGVSATALRAVGGVPARALSEDAALVERLEHRGWPVLWTSDLVVRTSARRSQRAPGGFSSLLDVLEQREKSARGA